MQDLTKCKHAAVCTFFISHNALMLKAKMFTKLNHLLSSGMHFVLLFFEKYHINKITDNIVSVN